MRCCPPPGQPGPMITATGLTKHYGHLAVVDNVTFRCEPGTITGFLGQNGAGKSTTLRMITGLIRPDSGQSAIDGQPFARLPNPARVVGTLLDASAMNVGRTGRTTLRIAAAVTGRPASRADELLEQVGLRRGRPPARRHLLTRHAAAAGLGARADRPAPDADSRRACQRPGSPGDRLDPRPAPRFRRPRRHGAAVQSPAAGDPGHRRPPHHHLRWPGRRRRVSERAARQFRRWKTCSCPSPPKGRPPDDSVPHAAHRRTAQDRQHPGRAGAARGRAARRHGGRGDTAGLPAFRDARPRVLPDLGRARPVPAAADHADDGDDRRVEPAHGADHVHAGASAGPGAGRQGDGWAAHRDRVRGIRARRRHGHRRARPARTGGEAGRRSPGSALFVLLTTAIGIASVPRCTTPRPRLSPTSPSPAPPAC